MCKVAQANGAIIVLCRGCNAKRKPFSKKDAAQKVYRFEQAGYFEPVCVVCNDPNLQILELDHLAGDANSTIVEPLCANHHGLKSFLAETGLMAPLRLRDPERSALALQAAFEIGTGALLGMFAVWDGTHGEAARCIILGVISAALFAWAAWNLSADSYFEGILGRGYDRSILAPVPR